MRKSTTIFLSLFLAFHGLTGSLLIDLRDDAIPQPIPNDPTQSPVTRPKEARDMTFARAARIQNTQLMDPTNAEADKPVGSQVQSEVRNSLMVSSYDDPNFPGFLPLHRHWVTALINDIVVLLIVLAGLYLSFFGFRIFGFLMLFVGFFFTYYSTLIICSLLSLGQLDAPRVQICLFVGGLFMGLGMTFMAYMERIFLYAVFGLACGAMTTACVVQFEVELGLERNIIAFLGVFFVASMAAAAATFLFFEQSLIFVSAFVGSTQTALSFGFLLRDLRPFYLPNAKVPTPYDNLFPYLLLFMMLFGLGLVTQYYLRFRILRRMRFTSLAKGAAEEPSRLAATSFKLMDSL